MNDSSPTDPCVGLVAADATGIAALRPAREILDGFGLAWRESILFAHGSSSFNAKGLRAVIVASADAMLPGALAVATELPVVRVPVPDTKRGGIDLLRDDATANLPTAGAAFATVAIGEAGAKNAALFIVSMFGLTDERLRAEFLVFRQQQTDAVLGQPSPAGT